MASFLRVWRALGPRLPSVALVALGLAALYGASSLSFGTLREPDSGFFPKLICVALIVFAGASFATPVGPSPVDDAPEPRGALRVWVVVVALVAYALALVPVGFLLCTAALIVLLLKGMGAVPWLPSLAFAVTGAAACYGLFTRLGVPLPAGVLGF